jgi:hypothetical protein
MSNLSSIVTNFGGPTGHFHEDYFWNGMNALPRFRPKAGLDNFLRMAGSRVPHLPSDKNAKIARTPNYPFFLKTGWNRLSIVAADHNFRGNLNVNRG